MGVQFGSIFWITIDYLHNTEYKNGDFEAFYHSDASGLKLLIWKDNYQPYL